MPTHVSDGLYQIEIPTPFKVGIEGISTEHCKSPRFT